MGTFTGHNWRLCRGHGQAARYAAGRLGVDAVHALDQSTPAAELADDPGFTWRGRGEWAPLAQPKEYFNPRPLSPAFTYRQDEREDYRFVSWDSQDPLSPLFLTWFGSFGDALSGGPALRHVFESMSQELHIKHGANVPSLADVWTPISATASGIRYTGEDRSTAGFFVLDPTSLSNLIAFWNVRASGAAVFPWPFGHADRVTASAAEWVEWLKGSGRTHRGVRGDGVEVEPRIDIVTLGPLPEIPQQLGDILRTGEVSALVSHPYLRGMCEGSHPFDTTYASSFRVPFDPDAHSFDVRMPEIAGISNGPRRDPLMNGVVALNVEVSSVSQIRPDLTFSVPNLRWLAPLLEGYNTADTRFHRPTPTGRAYGVYSGTDEIEVNALQTLDIACKLIEHPGWVCGQTDAGKFASQLIECLGGIRSTVAVQPGIRAALTTAVASHSGVLSGKLVARIRQYQGAWPEPLSHPEVKKDYPSHVLRYLLRRNVLRPVLPVTCPHCTTSVPFRPDDLSTTMKCEMCLRDFSLGLALGSAKNGRNDWLYQLAGHVGQQRINEILPLMAVAHILNGLEWGAQSTFAHVFGLELEESGNKCEIDVFGVLNEAGVPIVAIGEVKSRMGLIELTDLENLTRVQKHIVSIQGGG